MILRNATLNESGFDPITGQVQRTDSGMKRIVRGFFARKWYINVLNFLYFLGALGNCWAWYLGRQLRT